MPSAQPYAVVFDAYGTLFDVHSAASTIERLFPGRGTQLSQLWRSKQLEYTFLRTLGERYVDFWAVTESSLQYACDALMLPLDPGARHRLMQAYTELSPFPETLEVLLALRESQRQLAILSNGSPLMLRALVANAHMENLFAHVLSVDAVRQYKPAPAVYELACRSLGLPAQRIVFVSANGWDAAGAGWYGFRPYWVNRQAMPIERLDSPPRKTATSLKGLPEYLDHLDSLPN
jgi:2-haloacid dehalogenase